MPLNPHHPLSFTMPADSELSFEWGALREEATIACRSFRCTVTKFGQGPVRLYGIFAAPQASKPVPAILHIHGGGQTASPNDVAFWVERGYAAMSFDWTGPRNERPQEQVTHFPVDVEGDLMVQAEAAPSKRSKLLLAYQSARCCLEMLARQPEVDPRHIGIYGISWGGFLTWLVNGTATQVKAACSIFGTGGIHLPKHCANSAFCKMTPDARQTWLSFFDPLSYVRQQQSPMLHLNSTNDFFGGMDTLSDMLPRLNQPWQLDLTPNGNHHIGSASRRTLEKWFDHYLRHGPELPSTPYIHATVEDDGRVRVLSEATPDELELWYSSGSKPHAARCWKKGCMWEPLPDGQQTQLIPATGETWLYVRRRLADGNAVCSNILRLHAPTRESTAELSLYQPSQTNGIGVFMAPSLEAATEPTEAFPQDNDGLHGQAPGSALERLELRTPAAPETQAKTSTETLAVTLWGFQELSIQARTDVGLPTAHAYTAALKPEDGTTTVDRTAFVDESGSPLPAFRSVDAFLLTGRPRANARWRVNAIRWKDNTQSST